MIRKSGNRFSEKIMLKQKVKPERDSTRLKHALMRQLRCHEPERVPGVKRGVSADEKNQFAAKMAGIDHPQRRHGLTDPLPCDLLLAGRLRAPPAQHAAEAAPHPAHGRARRNSTA